MATTMTAVQGSRITHAIFIDLTLNNTTYYLSSAYAPIDINGNSYLSLGSLISVSDLTEDLKTSNGDITIMLSGIPTDQDYMGIVLNTPIKGGKVVIRRGFFDPDTMEILPGQVYNRYTGIITNYSIDEDFSPLDGTLSNYVAISCASLNSLLENRVSGQRTNSSDRKRLYPGDISFDRVKDLQNTDFDFGKEYAGGTGVGGWGSGNAGEGAGGPKLHQR